MKKGQTYIIVTEQMFSDQETCQIFKLCLYLQKISCYIVNIIYRLNKLKYNRKSAAKEA